MGVVISGKRGPMRADALNVIRGQKTRRSILDSARARVLSGSFEALRLDDLASDVGLTKAAVIKSVGGKASILLALGDEDRQTRLRLIRHAMTQRTGLKRRLLDLVRSSYELDAARMNVVMAYIGYMWFWTDADHDRAQAMLDDTRGLLCELIASASGTPHAPEVVRIQSLRLIGGYVIGLRDLRYDRTTLEASARFVVDYVLG